MLTGAPYYEYVHTSISADELWNYIDSRIKKNWVITCASHTNSGNHDNGNALGIADSHAYSVLGTD